MAIATVVLQQFYTSSHLINKELKALKAILLPFWMMIISLFFFFFFFKVETNNKNKQRTHRYQNWLPVKLLNIVGDLEFYSRCFLALQYIEIKVTANVKSGENIFSNTIKQAMKYAVCLS